jgi:hypothetical protein
MAVMLVITNTYDPVRVDRTKYGAGAQQRIRRVVKGRNGCIASERLRERLTEESCVVFLFRTTSQVGAGGWLPRSREPE